MCRSASGPDRRGHPAHPGAEAVAPLLGISGSIFRSSGIPSRRGPTGACGWRRQPCHRTGSPQPGGRSSVTADRRIVRANFDFALPIDAPPYDPSAPRQLLAEAGYPNGFDGGELTPFPPYNSMSEAIAGWLQAVGIRMRLPRDGARGVLTAWREKKLHGVVLTISGCRATRPRGSSPSSRRTAPSLRRAARVDDLFHRQAKELTGRSARRSCSSSSASCREAGDAGAVYHLGFPPGLGRGGGRSSPRRFGLLTCRRTRTSSSRTLAQKFLTPEVLPNDAPPIRGSRRR